MAAPSSNTDILRIRFVNTSVENSSSAWLDFGANGSTQCQFIGGATGGGAGSGTIANLANAAGLVMLMNLNGNSSATATGVIHSSGSVIGTDLLGIANTANDTTATSIFTVKAGSTGGQQGSGFFTAYPKSFSVGSLAQNAAFGCSTPDGCKNIVIFSNSSSTSGGTGTISLRGGGYDTAAEQMKIDLNGVTLPNNHSLTGTRFLCVDTNGKISASASACSGT
jgi:hypothetical protein